MFFFTRKVVPPVSSGQFTRVEGLILLLIFWKEILILFSLYEMDSAVIRSGGTLLQPSGGEGQLCLLDSMDLMA